MAKISYIDNDLKYVRAFIKRDYSDLAKEIKDDLSNMTYYFENNGKIYGYNIVTNKLLQSVYKMDFLVVHFFFVDIETLHNDEQEDNMVKLLEQLKLHMKKNKGYYNLKIPTNVVDLIRAYNRVGMNVIFCGGTVEQYIYGKKVPDNNKNNLNVFIGDGKYIKDHRDELLNMTYKSFESYQGQYHLSYVTGDIAGNIYKDWIDGSLVEDTTDEIIVAEYQNKPIGFVTIFEDDFSAVGMLAAVENEYRQYGAYKAMIAFIINYANSKGKAFVTGTQFDNLIVQGTWNSLGLQPFYSFYNFHIDARQ